MRFTFAVLCLVALANPQAKAGSEALPQAVMAPVPHLPFQRSQWPQSSPGQSQQSDQPQTLAISSSPAAQVEHVPACPPAAIPFLPTGFIFSALLPEAIYSYNTMTPVVAVLESDVKFLNRLVFPANARLIGNVSTVHTFDRANITFTLVVLPEGCEFPISAVALSADDGSSGVKGKLERHEDSLAAQIALKSALSAAQTGAQIAAPFEATLASNFTGEANQMVDQSISKVKSLESIYIRERTAIRVFVLRRFSRDVTAR
jgi:hypothetical protein